MASLTARIDERDEHVGEEIAEHDHERADHQDRHEDRIVARAESIDEEQAHAGPAEHRLRHQRAADQQAEAAVRRA